MRIRYGKESDGKLIKKAMVYTQDEHRINAADVDGDAVFVTGRLKANGYETYIVGGAVRDLMLGRKPKDFDIVTGATPAKIKKIFRNSRIIGRRFRLVHVFFGPKIFEVSTFRSLKDGHTSNTYGTIEEDVLRRDFSLNALFYDPEKQVVVDYVGGMKDIRARRLKPIIPPELIFKDDPVRMIRAVKYAASSGFSISWFLMRRIKKESSLLASVSPSRLTEELFKIIHSPYAALIIKNLEDAGLYMYLQQEASARMRTDPRFKERYVAGFAALTEAAQKPGTAMAALIRNYLEGLQIFRVDAGTWEEYKEAFTAARRFIFPMNPPRVELDAAVRMVFAEHGIDLKKKSLFDDENRRPRTQGRGGKSRGTSREGGPGERAGGTKGEAAGGEEAEKRSRRRRRRPSKKSE